MSKTTNNSCNSGVEGGSGYSFQKCCIVYLLFEKHDYLKKCNYFICVEHHEDFLFAYIDDSGNLKTVDTYQAKKSRSDWKTDKKLCEIIGKITKVGNELLNDPHPKHERYKQTLNFLTNKNIILNSKSKKGKQLKDRVQTSNKKIKYNSLHRDIRDNIKSKIAKEHICFKNELKNLSFQFIDLPQAHKDWRRTLNGLSLEVFGSRVNDHDATVTTLIKLLQDIELTYNDGNKVLLSDPKKKLTKGKIESTFDMFEDCKKSFDFWRSYSDDLAQKLNLKLPIKRKANEYLKNCFDYFKDLRQPEYRKIYKFVKSSTDIDEKHYSETDCIVDLFRRYKKKNTSRLDDYMIAFAVIAAYVETRDIYD